MERRIEVLLNHGTHTLSVNITTTPGGSRPTYNATDPFSNRRSDNDRSVLFWSGGLLAMLCEDNTNVLHGTSGK
jgi:hypothetical protein